MAWDRRSAKTEARDRDRVMAWDRDRQDRSDGLGGGFGQQTRIRQIAVAVAIDLGLVAFLSISGGDGIDQVAMASAGGTKRDPTSRCHCDQMPFRRQRKEIAASRALKRMDAVTARDRQEKQQQGQDQYSNRDQPDVVLAESAQSSAVRPCRSRSQQRDPDPWLPGRPPIPTTRSRSLASWPPFFRPFWLVRQAFPLPFLISLSALVCSPPWACAVFLSPLCLIDFIGFGVFSFSLAVRFSSRLPAVVGVLLCWPIIDFIGFACSPSCLVRRHASCYIYWR